MKTVLPFKIITISDESYHLMVKIRINGKVARMIIDTGASHSAFDVKKIKSFVKNKNFEKHGEATSGLGTNTMESHFTSINKIKLGELEILDYHAVLLDLSHVNESYVSIDLPEVDGVLGSDIFCKYNAVIDYKKQTLELTNKKTKK